MVAKKSIVGQIENRNFLAPTGFKFQLNRTPKVCLLYTSPSPRDLGKSRMPSSA